MGKSKIDLLAQERGAEINVNPVRKSPRLNPKPVEENIEEKPQPEYYDIKNLPEIKFQGKIQYYDDFNNLAMICDGLINTVEKTEDQLVPLGFDIEWPFSFQTGSGKTALLQICPSSDICYLFHVYSLKKLPLALIVLLKHPKVKLVGVNIKNDIWKLNRDFKEIPATEIVNNNCLDCGPFANQIYKRSCRWSLEKLTAYLLKKKISKDPQVRTSKWHIQPLSEAQLLYAATDAYVSLLLHLTIKKKADELALAKTSENSSEKIEN